MAQLTRAAIREMVVPSLLPILIPVIVGFGMNFLLGPGAGIRAQPFSRGPRKGAFLFQGDRNSFRKAFP